jgi:hypothetical protein
MRRAPHSPVWARELVWDSLSSASLREWRNGRRAGFRCQCPKGRGGSNPPSRTFSKIPGGLRFVGDFCIPGTIHPATPEHQSLREPSTRAGFKACGCPAASLVLARIRPACGVRQWLEPASLRGGGMVCIVFRVAPLGAGGVYPPFCGRFCRLFCGVLCGWAGFVPGLLHGMFSGRFVKLPRC